MIYKSIVENIKFNNKYLSNILDRCIYLDIETSGLSALTSSIVSITILIMEDEQTVVYQTFSIDEYEEEESLLFLAKVASTKDYVVTYNGNSFDLNYLNAKIKYYNIRFSFSSMKSIDLYKDMLSFKNKLELENNKLKTVEQYYGIPRKDELSGKEVITLYNAYKVHKKDTHRDLILQHNYEDVYNLPFLFDNILDTYDKIFYSNTFGLIKLNKKNMKFSNKSVKIELSAISDFKLDYSSDTIWYKFNYKKDASSIKIELYTSFFNTSSDNYIIFLNNDDIGLKSFNTLPNLKDNIIPLVINGTLLEGNVYSAIEKIISNI